MAAKKGWKISFSSCRKNSSLFANFNKYIWLAKKYMYVANTFVHQIHVNNPWRYLQYLKCTMRALLELSTIVWIVEYPLYIDLVTQTFEFTWTASFILPPFLGWLRIIKLKIIFFFFLQCSGARTSLRRSG